MMVKNNDTIKTFRKERGRKIYACGDRICLDVPKYIDQLTLEWINSQPSIATKIWEILIKAAHNDVGQAKSIDIVRALGLENVEKLTKILNASPTPTKYSRELDSLKKEKPKVNKIIEALNITDELNGLKEKNEENTIIKTEGIIEQPKVENTSEENLIISDSDQVTENSGEVNKDSADIFRKDGHMNLKVIVNKTGGSRRGLSRNTERSKLNSDKPNRMELEMYGEDKRNAE